MPLTKWQTEDVLFAAYQAEVAYRKHTFIDSDSIRSVISQLANYLTSDDSRFGMMLCGHLGNGKTTLLYALRSVISYLSDCDIWDEPKNLRIYTAKEIAQGASDDEFFNSVCKEPCLGIDDMGSEPKEILVYGNVRNPIRDLFEYRYDRQLLTVVTTNLLPEDIGKDKNYGKRISDRFAEMMDRIVFTEESYRKII